MCTNYIEKVDCMKISAISQNIDYNCQPRRNSFIKYSNSFMSVPEEEPEKDAVKQNLKSKKMGIECLETFTVFPKEVIDGKTIITA